MPSEEESIAKRILLVSELVLSSLPGSRPDPSNNAEYWEGVVGPALLAKAMTTAESMALLMPTKNAVDSLVLLRVLYENVVNLAWVAANPTYRLNRLRSEFHYWHPRENADWAHARRPILSSEQVNESEVWLRSHPKRLPTISERASVADKYWGAILAGWYEDGSDATDPLALSSLRGLGRYIYRRGSQAVHSHHRGLDPFVAVTEDAVTPRLEEPPATLIVWDLGLRLLLFAVGPSFKTLGWPSYEKARAIVMSASVEDAERK